MTHLSKRAAMSAGLSLIRNRPRAVLAWGAVRMLPALCVIPIIIPLMKMITQMDAAVTATPEQSEVVAQQMMTQMMGFQLVSLLANLVQLVVLVVVVSAVMRAILKPDQKAWASMRLSADELRVGLTGLVVVVSAYFALLLVMIFVAVIGGTVIMMAGPVGMLLFAPLMLVAMLPVWAGVARFGMILPASLDKGDFAFSEGIQVGKGQTLSLFLLCLTTSVITWCIAAALLAAMMGVVWVNGGQALFEAARVAGETFDPTPFMQNIFSRNWPLIIVGAVVMIPLGGALLAFNVGAYADAYRQLKDGAGLASAPQLG